MTIKIINEQEVEAKTRSARNRQPKTQEKSSIDATVPQSDLPIPQEYKENNEINIGGSIAKKE
jgi:hypothetical protein